MNKKIKKIIFLFLFASISVCSIAQVVVQGGSKVEATNVVGTVIQYITNNDPAKAIEILIAYTDSVRNEDKEQLKFFFNSLCSSLGSLSNENKANNTLIISFLQDIISLLSEFKEITKPLIDLKNLIESEKWKHLPFGVYQFHTKRPDKGILFAGTQVGLLGTSIGYCISAKQNFNKHKNSMIGWERNRYFNKYEIHRRNSQWCLAGAALMIGLNYFDNFNWFRKDNNKKLAAVPTFDWQGKPQIAMTFSVNF